MDLFFKYHAIYCHFVFIISLCWVNLLLAFYLPLFVLDNMTVIIFILKIYYSYYIEVNLKNTMTCRFSIGYFNISFMPTFKIMV